ncbi:LytR/AlgR family response regulator transcription factor [Synoicihabitans lomoniglobus]|uniref:LytTR family DNA-binding domain-containing protein n=1 Tax=Synoicihabitans lomoniglobus TaxID=2909285 RepID=A0AAE9ZXB0_9BACT|nr:LytTR family DNA-binding domain-containing protein [Opitutaceae bacterium LMO-M01]WED65201.1 LytTR family DNA-binding domain-containing protein [Opitutaceae bacterium LMO-M01]
MPSRHALLIDDEPLARIELRRLLQAHADITIVGEAGTLNEARERLAATDYDLVFLDIQLRGGTGFDLLEHIPPHARVIFVTAFDRYAVRAFDVNALDYLLKPVTAERLSASLYRLDPAEPTAPAGRGPESDRENAPPFTVEDRIFVKTGHTTRFIEIRAIVSIRSCENYTEIQLADGSQHLTLRTLKSWENTLPASIFARVHRQSLINLQHVRAIVRGEGEDVRFAFQPPLPEIAASRRCVAELRQRLADAGLAQIIP